jgi:hypothetical protein
MAGSEVRAGETDRPKGQHRAPARPYYYLLEDDLACWLLNAHHLRNVPGRKTERAFNRMQRRQWREQGQAAAARVVWSSREGGRR